MSAAFWTVALIVQALLGEGAFALRASKPRDAAGKSATAYAG
jgi:hypothetical protein